MHVPWTTQSYDLHAYADLTSLRNKETIPDEYSWLGKIKELGYVSSSIGSTLGDLMLLRAIFPMQLRQSHMYMFVIRSFIFRTTPSVSSLSTETADSAIARVDVVRILTC